MVSDAHAVIATDTTDARVDTPLDEHDEPPPWAAPALLLSILMLGADLVALIPLGEWMTDYGIIPVCTVYLVHVLSTMALAAWTVTRLPARYLDIDVHD
ncbi:hypothetical protein [Nocardia neocaledoniensis]|uniref:hypothetical protein n=1 Tax=Nocardia neocaledoniensis TaxID=236511 RepID=UPI002453BAED|nr:hypothetical protein [Nocardia neocaledoniensis]